MIYPKPSPELATLLRYTAERKVEDFKLVPVPPELFIEANKFVKEKYGKVFTRETMLLNGHLITPEGNEGSIPREIKTVGITIEAKRVQPLLESDD